MHSFLLRLAALKAQPKRCSPAYVAATRCHVADWLHAYEASVAWVSIGEVVHAGAAKAAASRRLLVQDESLGAPDPVCQFCEMAVSYVKVCLLDP